MQHTGKQGETSLLASHSLPTRKLHDRAGPAVRRFFLALALGALALFCAPKRDYVIMVAVTKLDLTSLKKVQSRQWTFPPEEGIATPQEPNKRSVAWVNVYRFSTSY